VSSDGSADRAAELVLLQRRTWLPGRIPEKRIGVENVVAQEFPGVSVKLVLAGSRNQIHIGNPRAIPGVVLRGLNFKFRNRIGVRDGGGGNCAVYGKCPGGSVAIYIHALGAGSQQSGVVDTGGGP